MTNFLNDLNKMVNTIQKVDRMLTEKPKRQKTKYITKRFTEEELNYLRPILNYWSDQNYNRDKEEEKLFDKIYHKLFKVS